MSAVDCTVAEANPLGDVESNFKDTRPVRLTNNDLVVSHYDRVSVMEDVKRLSLYGKVGTFLVIRIAVLELESYSPVSVADHAHHPFGITFIVELPMHSNLDCLLLILTHTIFLIFLTRCQFGILRITNVLPRVLIVHLCIILELKIFLHFVVGCTLD